MLRTGSGEVLTLIESIFIIIRFLYNRLLMKEKKLDKNRKNPGITRIKQEDVKDEKNIVLKREGYKDQFIFCSENFEHI